MPPQPYGNLNVQKRRSDGNLRFVRRNMGKEAARRAFGETRALRKSGAVGYRFYLAHASIELRVNGEPEVARRVLEHGLSQHEGYIAETEYVLEYVDFLTQVCVENLCVRAKSVCVCVCVRERYVNQTAVVVRDEKKLLRSVVSISYMS